MPLGIPNFVSNLFSSLKKTEQQPEENMEVDNEMTGETDSKIIKQEEETTATTTDEPSASSSNPETNLNLSASESSQVDDKTSIDKKNVELTTSEDLNKTSLSSTNNDTDDDKTNKDSTTVPKTDIIDDDDKKEVKEIAEATTSSSSSSSDNEGIKIELDTVKKEEDSTSSSSSNNDKNISETTKTTTNLNNNNSDSSNNIIMDNSKEIINTESSSSAAGDANNTQVASPDKVGVEPTPETPVFEVEAAVLEMDVAQTEDVIEDISEETELETGFSERETEQEDTEAEPGITTDMEIEEKENNEEAITEDMEDESGTYMEITRRRVSQDRDGNCYCGKDRNLNIAELLCASCNRWYHESCIGYQLGKLVPFMMNYVFICKNCSPTGLESFKRNQALFNQMCTTALANLTQGSAKEGTNKKMFSKDKDIIPFFEMHWEGMTTTTRRVTQSWHSTVTKALQKDTGTHFTMEETLNDPDSPYFGLMCPDLTQIRPNYDAMIKGGHLKVTELGVHQSSNAIFRGRGAKRRTVCESVALSQASVAKKTRGDAFLPKMITGHGYPVDHPYNKDGYRYILAEPDSNAPYRQEFDESSDWAGKAIPSWLYRVLNPCSVLLALHDRAPQLKVSDDRLSVTGEKGYCMIRATHGITKGCWYWEAKITDMPEGSHTRIGWSQAFGNLQGPLGYDRFGYSWRSRYGTKFHDAKGKSYCKGGYTIGDVLGFLIEMPDTNPETPSVPSSYKDRPLVRFKSHLYYEDKTENAAETELKSSRKGSKIICFKNGICQGVAFEDIYDGTYYPAVSLFRGVTVNVNFGPDFWAEPDKNVYHHKGMNERAEGAIVEQTVSDLMFLTENDGKLLLDNPPIISQL